MKIRILISTAFLFLTGFKASAQYDTEIDFGLKFNYVRTSLNLSEGLDQFTDGGHDNGYQLGAFLRIRVNHIYFQPELLIADTRSVLTAPTIGVWNDVEVQFDFVSVEVPLMIGYKLGPARLMVGPVFSFLADTETAIGTSTTGVPGPTLRDGVEEAFNTISLQARFGAGVDVGKFSFELMYEYGLSRLYEEILLTGFGDAVKKQNEWVVGVGYRFIKLKK